MELPVHLHQISSFLKNLWWVCMFVSKVSIRKSTRLSERSPPVYRACIRWSLCRIITLPLFSCCRCTEQPSSFMSLTQRRTCRSVSAHSLVCPALISDLMGPGVFTATRASVSSPTGPSSSPSGAFSHSSTDTPSLAHMPCLLKSLFFCFYFFLRHCGSKIQIYS